jgi:prepilin-type processing-associated H-X9-DG protein
LWSDHPGGVQLLFCDGHVSFFSEEVEQSALNAVLTRSGRDHVSR